MSNTSTTKEPRNGLTNGDVARIRQQVIAAPFVHWGRLASEWGLTVRRVKALTEDIRK